MEAGKRFFLILCVLSLIDSTNYAFFIPIMPDFLISQGISLSLIGVILSFFQIGSLCCSLYLSKYLLYQSKKNLLIMGQILLILANFGFATISPDFPIEAIIFLALALRFIQGVAFCLIFSISNYNLTVLYPQNLDKYYATFEIWRGIGYSLGPVIGGLIYEFMSYSWCFIIIAVFYSIMSLLLFPKILKYQAEMEAEIENSSPFLKRPITSFKILKNKDFLLTFFVFIFSFMCYCVIQPKFSQHIHDYTDLEYAVGLVFGVGDFTYAMSGFLVIHIIMRLNFTRKNLFIMGGSLSMASLLLLGPEEYTFLPKSLVTIIIGMIVLGFSQMIYIPILIPEICEIMKKNDQSSKGKKEMACCLFSFALALTQIFGSIIGGVLGDKFGFERGMAIYAVVLFGYLGFFAVFSKQKENYKEKINENEKKSEIESLLILEKSEAN